MEIISHDIFGEYQFWLRMMGDGIYVDGGSGMVDIYPDDLVEVERWHLV